MIELICVDLGTIETGLEQGKYLTKAQFCADVKRIFSNCREYNQPGTIYFKSANQLESAVSPLLERLKDRKKGEKEELAIPHHLRPEMEEDAPEAPREEAAEGGVQTTEDA